MRLEARDDKSSVATCEYLNENARIRKRVDRERKDPSNQRDRYPIIIETRKGEVEFGILGLISRPE